MTIRKAAEDTLQEAYDHESGYEPKARALTGIGYAILDLADAIRGKVRL